MRHRWVLFPALAAALAGGCVSDGGKDTLPSSLQAQLDDTLRRVRFAHGVERLKYLRRLSAFGAYATERVEREMLVSDDASLRSNAVFVLGEIYRLDGDERALKAVRAALDDPDRSVRLEAARALLDAGDLGGIEQLLGAMIDGTRAERVNAFLAVAQAAGGQTMGYHPDAPKERRAEAVRRLRGWFAERAGRASAGGSPERRKREGSGRRNRQWLGAKS